MWSSPEVCRYSGPATDLSGRPIRLPAESPDDSDKIIEFFLSRRQDGTGFRWALISLATGRFVGAAGFNSLRQSCEIAYHMDPRYWGKGLMVEACRAAMHWALCDFGAREIVAFVEPDNARSIRLVERLGMTPSGESEGNALKYSTGDAQT
jgi:ribosomal-protein-alanine N-acetyltransferase